MEVRVFAFLAGETRLLEKDNVDIYTRLARQVFKTPSLSDVSNWQRQRAKTLCLGIMYGMVGRRWFQVFITNSGTRHQNAVAISKSLSNFGEERCSLQSAKRFRERFMAQV
jgi:hypothetical protein